MDTEALRVLKVIEKVGHSIRLPTARWLCADVLKMLDSVTNNHIRTLIEHSRIKVDKGGWITITHNSYRC